MATSAVDADNTGLPKMWSAAFSATIMVGAIISLAALIATRYSGYLDKREIIKPQTA